MSTTKPKGRLGTAAQLATPTRHTEPTQPTKGPAPTAAGGRPARASYRRMHVIMAEQLAEYLEGAWRTHRRPDGSFASGPSQFIEDLVAEHRDRTEKAPRRPSSKS